MPMADFSLVALDCPDPDARDPGEFRVHLDPAGHRFCLVRALG